MSTRFSPRFLALATAALLTPALAIAQAAPAVPQASSAPQTPTAAPEAPQTPPSAPAGTVRIGKDLKKTSGKVTELEKGDNGCYLVLEDAKGNEFIEVGVFDICTQKPPLKGKKVALEYREESIAASSCAGNPKCTKKETVPLVVSAKIVD